MPGAWFTGGGKRIRVLQAAAEAQAPNVPPGTVIDDRLAIACGNGVLRPLRLQRPGRGALDADAFLRGFPIPAGTLLPCPATS
jgi:methionyl-tRNA formyltransferase